MPKPAINQPAENGSVYRGRFAPSPSGPLHFGSLVAAVASYLEALTRNGEWLLRIEDIDPPREMPGAADAIIKALEVHGFEWTGPVHYQSQQTKSHEALLTRLLQEGKAYFCACSREDIRMQNPHEGPMGVVYPGTCRERGLKPNADQELSVRLRAQQAQIAFKDALQGVIECNLEKDIGDIVLRRKDGLIGYSLAVVADDDHQGITDIVRGTDLLMLTPAHIHLQQQLGMRTPRYMHVPVAVNQAGAKLSKQTGAEGIDPKMTAQNLVQALRFLGQNPPTELLTAKNSEIWQWGKSCWQPQNMAMCREITI